MATNQRPVQRDIFAESDSPSVGLIGLLRMVLFQPRQFFKQIESAKHGLTVALLILALIAYGAVQQASPASSPVDSGGVPPMDGGIPPMDGLPVDGGGGGTTADPSQAWMVGLSAAGTQVIYWAVLTMVLSEVSLFNGKAPQFGLNLQIAIWATVPVALMAGVQILFIMGGGKIGAAGFSGFLQEWETYASLNIMLQSALYALASQISLFWLWGLGLLYLGAREGLKGKRLAIALVLVMWVTMLTLAFGYQKYQVLSAQSPEMPLEGEFMPDGEFPMEGEIMPEGETPLDDGENIPQEDNSSESGGRPIEPDRSGGKP